MKASATATAVAVFALVAATLVLAAPSNAASHWSKLVVSRHGHIWSTSLGKPLFGRHTTLVPGEQKMRTFYVRNQSNDGAMLTVSLQVIGDRNGLLARQAFRLGVKRHGQFFHRVQPTSTGLQMRPVTIRSGEVLPLTVRVRLLSKAINATMRKHLAFTIGLRLTQRVKRG